MSHQIFPPRKVLRLCLSTASAIAIQTAVTSMLVSAVPAQSNLKTETFDRDPHWEGYNNRIVPDRYPTITQDFGYRQSNFAGKSPGEMGGQITRASEPAFYADSIESKTLDDELSASGTFAFTKTTAGAGVFFGFFRAKQPGGGGRPISSLGMDFDCEGGGARLALRLITAKNQSCGTFITPFIPGKFRPTPLRNDGTRYMWTLHYDPAGAAGKGRVTFTLHGSAPKPGELETENIPESHKQEARSHFPSTTTFTFDLPAGYKQHGTAVDHFGLMNLMKPGGTASIYFDDLTYLGRSQDFVHDPHWDAEGNQVKYQTKDVGGAHNFGFSDTDYAGGKRGEVGGTFWRGGKYGYYADRVGPLSLDKRLEAGGNVALKVGGPDADMFLGWFNSANKNEPPVDVGNFLGVHVGGPTRVGHYFQPYLTTANGAKAKVENGPVLAPGKVQTWSLEYDPDADNGKGAVRVTLDNESVTLHLKKGVKAQGAHFDRFGLFTSTTGGQMVKIYLDDIKYTASSGTR
jgi:hypothetical protein